MSEKEMKIAELADKIERLKRAIWYEEMADFMNWSSYYSMKIDLAKYEREMAALTA